MELVLPADAEPNVPAVLPARPDETVPAHERVPGDALALEAAVLPDEEQSQPDGCFPAPAEPADALAGWPAPPAAAVAEIRLAVPPAESKVVQAAELHSRIALRFGAARVFLFARWAAGQPGARPEERAEGPVAW